MDNYIRRARVIKVIDGDTIEASVDLGFNIWTRQRFRLLGINTPERDEVGYNEATQFTVEKVLDKVVHIESRKTDKYGRYLATVHLSDGTTLNQLLLQKGYAKEYMVN